MSAVETSKSRKSTQKAAARLRPRPPDPTSRSRVNIARSIDDATTLSRRHKFENSDAKHDVERSKLIDDLREVITDAKDDVKGQASGQELELQMASQEYSRSSQLASSLLNVRNEVMKNFVQALRG